MGTVEGDLVAAGQAVVLNGTVNDDVRVAGQVLMLGTGARIADDLVAAGFSLESKTGSTIGGDLVFGGAQALLTGSVRRDVIAGMTSLELCGTVGRNVNVLVTGDLQPFNPPFLPQPPVSIPKVPVGLALADSARIGSKLIYKSPTLVEADISPSAQIGGGVVREEIEAAPYNQTTVAWNNLQHFLTLLLVGLLLLWVIPTWTQRLVDTVQSKPLPSLGWGLVVLLGVGVLAIAISVVTLLLASLFSWFLIGLVPLLLGIGLLINVVLILGFLLFIGYVPQIIVSFLLVPVERS